MTGLILGLQPGTADAVTDHAQLTHGVHGVEGGSDAARSDQRVIGLTNDLAHAANVVEPAPSDDPTARAQQLYREAKTAYDLADYDTAIDLFTESYKLTQTIPDPALRNKALLALQFNLAKAHVEAYSIDRESQHLRVARNLLQKQLATEALAETDRAVAQSLLEDIDAQLAEADAAGTDPVADDPDTVNTTPPAAGANRPETGPVADGTNDGDASARRDRAKMSPLKLGGIISLAGAGAGLGALAAGAVIAAGAQNDFEQATTGGDVDAAERRGRTGNLVAIAGGVSAGVLAATGVALLVVDRRRSSATSVAWLPVFSLLALVYC